MERMDERVEEKREGDEWMEGMKGMEEQKEREEEGGGGKAPPPRNTQRGGWSRRKSFVGFSARPAACSALVTRSKRCILDQW